MDTFIKKHWSLKLIDAQQVLFVFNYWFFCNLHWGNVKWRTCTATNKHQEVNKSIQLKFSSCLKLVTYVWHELEIYLRTLLFIQRRLLAWRWSTIWQGWRQKQQRWEEFRPGLNSPGCSLSLIRGEELLHSAEGRKRGLQWMLVTEGGDLPPSVLLQKHVQFWSAFPSKLRVRSAVGGSCLLLLFHAGTFVLLGGVTTFAALK